MQRENVILELISPPPIKNTALMRKISHARDTEMHSGISNIVRNVLIHTANISGPVGIQRLAIQR